MSSRALRVGVLIGDSLVEEKILDTSAPITLGQSLHCTLSIPIEAVPREHVLFTVDDGRFLLHPTAAMDGRVGQRDEIIPLAAATIALSRGARGKLVLGDATILFQEIAKPAPAPRAQLPASIRGTFADRIDRRLAAIVGGSLALHIGIAAWAWSSDAQAARYDLPVTSEFQQVTIDTPSLAQLAPAPTAPTQPGAATPVAPPRAISHPSRPALPALPPTLRPDDALRMANILTTEETGHGYGGMSAHRPGTGLERELEEIQSQHREVTIGDDGRGPRKTTTQIDRDPRNLPIGDPNYVPLAPTKELTDKGRVKLDGAKSDDKTTLTPQAVLDLVNTQYMAGLQRCYRRGLALDASLSGKVALSFTVDESGKLTEPSAAGSDAQVDHCIQSLMGVWRFPIPHDDHGQPTDATFHISLALQPS